MVVSVVVGSRPAQAGSRGGRPWAIMARQGAACRGAPRQLRASGVPRRVFVCLPGTVKRRAFPTAHGAQTRRAGDRVAIGPAPVPRETPIAGTQDAAGERTPLHSKETRNEH